MIIPLERVTEILDEDNHLTLRAAVFFEELVIEINLNTPIQGTGSPEGVIVADIGQRYMNTTGASGSVLYIKQTGSGNTGWVLS